MARNQFIEQEKRYRRLIHETTPMMYAAFALSLHRRHGFGYKRILQIMLDTQEYWQAHARGECNIIQMCAEEVGLNMVSEATAKQYGIKGKTV